MIFKQLLERCLNGDSNAIDNLNNLRRKVNPNDIELALDQLEHVKESNPLYSQALYLKAILYLKLKYNTPNKKLAIEFLEKSYKLNNTWAMWSFACLYRDGLCVVNDQQKAIELYTKAAELNNPLAMCHLALHYQSGTEEDKKKAIELYERASELGCRRATNHLVDRYLNNPKRILYFAPQAEIDSRIKLCYRAYKQNSSLDDFDNNSNSSKDKALLGLNTLAPYEKLARKYLISIYLKTNNFNKVKALYNTDPIELWPLLVKKLVSLYNKFSENQELIKKLHGFLVSLGKNSSKKIPLSLLAYHSLKVKLSENKIEAVDLYVKYKSRIKDYLTADDFYNLGNVVLNDVIDGESKDDKHKRITQACWFYYQAHQKGDEVIHSVIIKLLNQRDNKEYNQNNLPTLCQKEIEQKKDEDSLTDSLTQEIQLQRSSLIALATATLKWKEMELAKKLLNHLDEGFSLKEILILLPSLLASIKKNQNGFLYHKLATLLPEDNQLLLPSLSDEECKNILKHNNSGEIIYHALNNHAISPDGLKILAKHKERVVKYVKTLKDEEKAQFLSQFDFNQADGKMRRPSTASKYFNVQRSFFKPGIYAGTLGQLREEKENLALHSLNTQPHKSVP